MVVARGEKLPSSSCPAANRGVGEAGRSGSAPARDVEYLRSLCGGDPAEAEGRLEAERAGRGRA